VAGSPSNSGGVIPVSQTSRFIWPLLLIILLNVYCSCNFEGNIAHNWVHACMNLPKLNQRVKSVTNTLFSWVPSTGYFYFCMMIPYSYNRIEFNRFLIGKADPGEMLHLHRPSKSDSLGGDPLNSSTYHHK
jgi:hypothetical protein